MEIIKKFLEGEEDPDYEVIPTVTEGKYFVKPRKQAGSKRKRSKDFSREHSDEDTTGSEEEDISDDFGTDSNKQPKPPKPPKPSKPLKPPKSLVRHEPYYDPTISYQILEQLKLLGEEQRHKRQKKEQKKLVKKQIQKQMRRTKKQETDSEDEYYEHEDFSEDNIKDFGKDVRRDFGKDFSRDFSRDFGKDFSRDVSKVSSYFATVENAAPVRRRVNLLK